MGLNFTGQQDKFAHSYAVNVAIVRRLPSMNLLWEVTLR